MQNFSAYKIIFKNFCLTALLKSVKYAASLLENLQNAGIAQLVEHDLAKVGVASSSLVSRSNLPEWWNR